MKKNLIKPLVLLAMLSIGTCAYAQQGKQEKAQPGKFAPTWGSLSQYETPEWFRNAKFGIWAHWGPMRETAFF